MLAFGLLGTGDQVAKRKLRYRGKSQICKHTLGVGIYGKLHCDWCSYGCSRGAGDLHNILFPCLPGCLFESRWPNRLMFSTVAELSSQFGANSHGLLLCFLSTLAWCGQMPRMLAVAAESCIKDNKTEKRAALALMLKCAPIPSS